MTDMQAALGLCQLELLDEILAERGPARRALHGGDRDDPRPRAAVRAGVRGADLAVVRGARSPRTRRSTATELMRRLLHRRRAHAPRRDGDPPRAVLRRHRRASLPNTETALRRLADAAALRRAHRRAAGPRHRLPRHARDGAVGGVTPAPLLIVGGGRLRARDARARPRRQPRRAALATSSGSSTTTRRVHGRRVARRRGRSARPRRSHEHPDALVALCVASPGNPRGPARRSCARLGLDPERYATLVHPAAVVARVGARSGRARCCTPATVLTADVTLGRARRRDAGRRADARRPSSADGVTFGAGARVAGGVTIEDARLHRLRARSLREGIAVGARRGRRHGRGRDAARPRRARSGPACPARRLAQPARAGGRADEAADARRPGGPRARAQPGQHAGVAPRHAGDRHRARAHPRPRGVRHVRRRAARAAGGPQLQRARREPRDRALAGLAARDRADRDDAVDAVERRVRRRRGGARRRCSARLWARRTRRTSSACSPSAS